MSLSNLINMPLFVGKTHRGFCVGIGVSLKTFQIKYLLCSTTQNRNQVDFYLNVSCINTIDDCIRLRALRATTPKPCAKLTLDLPVFTHDGTFLGHLTDVELQNFFVTRLIIDQNQTFPISALSACLDAVILRKELPFPIGQRVPAPFLCKFSSKVAPVVTKPTLREAMQKRTLVKLTLSLPPFGLHIL